MFKAESLELLARRRPARLRGSDDDSHNALLRADPDAGRPDTTEDPDDSIDPDDSAPRFSERVADQNVEKVYTLPALPPLSPDWFHLLGGRPHSPASASFARMALEAVGCRLAIHPSPNALCEAAGCHSVGAVSSLLVRHLGEQGLATAYQLAGSEKPPIASSRLDGVASPDATAGPPDLLSPEVLRSLPPRVARFFLHEPRTPSWRTSRPLSEADDGSWCG